MIIQRLSASSGGLCPEALEVLCWEFEASLYHTRLDLRHPLGIYNTSLVSIFESFESVLEELTRIAIERPYLNPQSPDKWEDVLLEHQRRLLYYLMEHMDDCQSILRCFFDPRSDYMADSSVKLFKKSVKSYRDHIGRVVNHIKHSQGRLRPIIFFNGNAGYPGYFVEGLDDTGTLCPAPHIHRGSNTAFSFSRDLRFHLFSVYMVSSHLATAISQIIGDKKTVSDHVDCHSDKIVKVAVAVSQLPLIFYPDEADQPVPNVRVEEDEQGETLLTLAFPDTVAKVRQVPLPSKVFVSYRGDAVSRAFRTPYSH
jgi:hypothetical protein